MQWYIKEISAIRFSSFLSPNCLLDNVDALLFCVTLAWNSGECNTIVESLSLNIAFFSSEKNKKQTHALIETE